MGPGCGTAMLGGVGLGFANVGPRRAGRDRRRRRHRRPGGGVPARRAPAPACRRSSASAAATCRPRSAGSCSAQAMRAARGRRRRPRRCCSSPSRRTARRCSALGDVDVGGKRVVAAFVGWDGGDAPFEVHPTLEAGALRAAAGAAAGDAGAPTDAARRRGRRRCSGCSPAGRWRTRRETDPRRAGHADPRPRRGGVHPGPAAPDGRPRAAAEMLREQGPRGAAACCSTWCSATAPTPTRRASSRRALDALAPTGR